MLAWHVCTKHSAVLNEALLRHWKLAHMHRLGGALTTRCGIQMAISAAVHTSYREVEMYLGGLATCLHIAYREEEVQEGGGGWRYFISRG